jgi:hypothetical protein
MPARRKALRTARKAPSNSGNSRITNHVVKSNELSLPQGNKTKNFSTLMNLKRLSTQQPETGTT